VEHGPGADDDASGTAVLLESARVLKDRPLPATIVFVFYTGEESGLLGSREFTRRAVAEGLNVVGALNNDMVGFSVDHRLTNTIRYSNDGIRDLQHAAAFLFSNLVTYDARYYKGTDAHSLFDAYGDIVGGIGSYPVLASPHYHQPHDVLETIDHQRLKETTRTNVASLMLLASSPSRLKGLEATRQGKAVEVRWTAAPEKEVRHYLVRYTAEGGAERTVTVAAPNATLEGVRAGTVIAVKAVNARGLEGWDWARVEVR
jgi:Zn-dependent M28 family amino/carboxypeptidase